MRDRRVCVAASATRALTVLCIIVAACKSEPSEATQARALLEQIAVLDPSAPEGQRAQQLDRLEQLPLRVVALARVRDQCLSAHRGLLRAEREQGQAKQALDQAAARHGDTGIPPARTQEIAAAIDRSNAALAQAQLALPDCDRQTRELTKRYR